MRASSLRLTPRPISGSQARNFALINQLATPGLGSLMAGRWLAGAGQLILALAGAGMVTAWFVLVVVQVYNQIDEGAQPRSVAWLGEAGALVFAAGWLWALLTSLSLIREAREEEGPLVPPRLPPGDQPGRS
jgi:hypothetical protein